LKSLKVKKFNMPLTKDEIAKRVAQEVREGMYVNLGIGIPTLVANYVPAHSGVIFQSENGLLGMGPFPTEDQVDPDLINAGKQTVTALPGACFFNSAESFAMIRGGHIDLTILGAMEVSENGDLANWKIPGKLVKGMGGAMDLAASSRYIIVAMTHCSQDGKPKLLKKCNLPLTGIRCVKKVFTDFGVFDIEPSGGFVLIEKAKDVSINDIIHKTEGNLRISTSLIEINV
jgi:3-oxoacid CoA-transferase B subunit